MLQQTGPQKTGPQAGPQEGTPQKREQPRIAVLAHNTIVKDARILKEMAVLGERHGDITAFGIQHRTDPVPETLPLDHARLRLAERTMTGDQAIAHAAGIPLERQEDRGLAVTVRQTRRADRAALVLFGLAAMAAAAGLAGPWAVLLAGALAWGTGLAARWSRERRHDRAVPVPVGVAQIDFLCLALFALAVTAVTAGGAPGWLLLPAGGLFLAGGLLSALSGPERAAESWPESAWLDAQRAGLLAAGLAVAAVAPVMGAGPALGLGALGLCAARLSHDLRSAGGRNAPVGFARMMASVRWTLLLAERGLMLAAAGLLALAVQGAGALWAAVPCAAGWLAARLLRRRVARLGGRLAPAPPRRAPRGPFVPPEVRAGITGMTAVSPKTGAAVPVWPNYSTTVRLSYHLTEAVLEDARAHGAFDIIHAHDLAALDAGVKIKQRQGGRLIWDAHEIYEDLGNPSPEVAAIARMVIARAAPMVDGFITVNDRIAEHYREIHPALPPATVIMNATLRRPVPEDDGRLRRALGLGPQGRILLYQGGFSMHRGLQALVRSARNYPAGWCLAMMGGGHLEDELKEIAAEVNTAAGEERVRFLPAVPNRELVFWTAGADLGAIPYENVAMNHWLCSPNKIWEYPAAGVPILAPRLKVIEDIVGAYGTGFLFDAAFDADTISGVMADIDDAALAEKRAAIPRFLQEMSWDSFAPRLHDLYDRMLAEGGAVERPAGEDGGRPA